MTSGLLARSRELLPRLVELRRRLHQNPELSYHETETQAFLEGELSGHGFESRRIADTGLLAVQPGGPAGRTVALRAELDALPIVEATGLPYRSRNEGVMHACGHDAHMAMVFGAGLLVRDQRPDLAAGTVLLFQPAEEVPPGGAVKVLASKALEESNVSGIFGLHVDPRYPAGQLLLRKGPLMAASDRFRITIEGTGGHGGYPHLTVDPVVVTAQVVLALQTIVSRRVDPVEPAVISVGRIEGGTADNIIPGIVTLSGTLRSHSAEVRRRLPEWIAATASQIAASAGARADFEYFPGHPGLSNDPAIIDFVESAVRPVLGADRVTSLPKPIMGGEDFAHYLEAFPGAFLRLGVRNEAEGCVHPIHSPKFKLDEEALAVGAAALAGVAIAWLEAEKAPY